MFEVREARLSLKRDIQDIFTSGSIFSEVYNIYGEDDLKNGTVPTHPYLYLLDSWVIWEANHLPVVVLESNYQKQGFELGNDPTGFCLADVYVFGKNRGQRDDFASAIMDITGVNIRDFDTSGYPIQSTAPLEPIGPDVYWDMITGIPLPQELAFEGSLLNSAKLSSAFRVMST